MAYNSYIEKPDYRILGKCPVCRAQFQNSGARLVERAGESALFHIDCGVCKSSVLMMIMATPLHMVTTIGMITDTTKDDITRLKFRKRVNADDVLALHAFIENRR